MDFLNYLGLIHDLLKPFSFLLSSCNRNLDIYNTSNKVWASVRTHSNPNNISIKCLNMSDITQSFISNKLTLFVLYFRLLIFHFRKIQDSPAKITIFLEITQSISIFKNIVILLLFFYIFIRLYSIYPRMGCEQSPLNVSGT